VRSSQVPVNAVTGEVEITQACSRPMSRESTRRTPTVPCIKSHALVHMELAPDRTVRQALTSALAETL
jgi:hypothetical protein